MHRGITSKKEANHFLSPTLEDLNDPYLLSSMNNCVIRMSAALNDGERIGVFGDFDTDGLTGTAVLTKGLENLGAFLASALQIVRVYTRIPGKSADLDRPFTVRQGGTVRDVARLVHKDIAHSLKFARLWGGGQFAGQRVSAEYQVADGDIIELHSGS